MNAAIYNLVTPPDNLQYEVVERKGIGHPDTLVDGIAEKISVEYSKYCLQNFGAVLHHNLDKVSIIGGLVDLDFGRGEMLQPARLVVNGRMSEDFAGQTIDLSFFQKEVAKQYIQAVLPHMDVENWLDILVLTNSYSHNPYWYHPRNLDDLPEIKRPYANDTSTTVGYWPLSTVERLNLALEGYFYDENGRPRFSYLGQDIKVLSVRKASNVAVTMCIPFIPTHTPDAKFYQENKIQILDELHQLANQITGGKYNVNIQANTVDKPENNDYYLLLTGSCIEAGEEGVVGRGNKSRGTISSVRPYSMEASNGKNPVYHVGKVHTVIADTLARAIAEELDCSCNIHIAAQNGEPLYQPSNLIIDVSRKVSQKRVQQIVESQLSRRDWTDRILFDEVLIPRPGGK